MTLESISTEEKGVGGYCWWLSVDMGGGGVYQSLQHNSGQGEWLSFTCCAEKSHLLPSPCHTTTCNGAVVVVVGKDEVVIFCGTILISGDVSLIKVTGGCDQCMIWDLMIRRE